MTFTLGIDTSTHQDNAQTPQRIDWDKADDLGVKFVVNRAVYVAAKDDDFDYNWACQRGKYLRGAYGFLGYWAGAPSITQQVQAVVNTLRPDPGEFPVYWEDMEKASDAYPELPARATLLSMLEAKMKGVEDGLGLGSGLYTNLAGLLKIQPVPTWLHEKPLWLAWPVIPVSEPPRLTLPEPACGPRSRSCGAAEIGRSGSTRGKGRGWRWAWNRTAWTWTISTAVKTVSAPGAASACHLLNRSNRWKIPTN